MGRWGTRMISDVSPGTDNPELFLIDGNSMAYRAFFALPDSMATADGRPTNAIFGLASMMVKLISDYRPRQIVVAWDAGMSGREVVYAEYKAQRLPKPDLPRAQWPHLVELVDAFGYTNIKVDGYEADDVIASLVAEARRKSITTVVVTGDRDAYQLVGDGVTVMSTSRGVTGHQDLRRRSGRALRRLSEPGHRPDGPARRHLRQHPRRARHRREDRCRPARAVRHARGRTRQCRSDLGQEAQGEPQMSSSPRTRASPRCSRR